MFGLFKSAPAGREIKPAEAFEKGRAREIYLVDVRELGEWQQARVEGSIHAPLSTLQENAATLPTDKPIALLCLSGRRSADAARLLESTGRTCSNVEGGLVAWRQAGLPLSIER